MLLAMLFLTLGRLQSTVEENCLKFLTLGSIGRSIGKVVDLELPNVKFEATHTVERLWIAEK